MIEIAAAACLMSSPEQCRDVTLTFEVDNYQPAMCMTVGQIELAQWVVAHPDWRITKFSCRPAGQVAKL
jgi:hypothetical protein